MAKEDRLVIYEYTCGHKAGKPVHTSRIGRACPVCRQGRIKWIYKTCVTCGAMMSMMPGSSQRKYCDRCQQRRNRANSFVNSRKKHYTPMSQIDVDAVLEGREEPHADPLDIVFAKYEADPFYRPPRPSEHPPGAVAVVTGPSCSSSCSTAGARGGNTGPTSTPKKEKAA